MPDHTILLMFGLRIFFLKPCFITYYLYLKLKWENLKRVRVLVDFAVHVMAKTGILNSLLYYYTGTKLACGVGGCGACTVMISEKDWATSKIRYGDPLVVIYGNCPGLVFTKGLSHALGLNLILLFRTLSPNPGLALL